MEPLVTYLRLTPEFGGTRFGPFEGLEVRLGSDPDHCHIVLPENLGVFGQHVKLVRQSAQNLILSPAERTATVYLHRAGAHGSQQVTTPTAVRPGDSFSLVSPDGPTFVIEADELPEEEVEEGGGFFGGGGGKPKSRMARRLTPKALAGEGKRQVWTRILVMGPAQMAQRAWVFVRSGAIYQPRYIFMGVAMFGGWIFGGMSMCSASSSKKEMGTWVRREQTCSQELQICQSMSGDATEQSFEELVGGISGLGEPLINTLTEDDALRDAVKRKVGVYMTDTTQWDWLVKSRLPKRTREFAGWRARVVESAQGGQLDQNTARLAVWLAAQPNAVASDFVDIENSDGEPVCGRGPLALSYRHAVSLGLEAQPDAFVGGNLPDIQDDLEKREQMLINTMKAASRFTLPEQLTTTIDPVRAGSVHCLYNAPEDGVEDERTESDRLMRMVRQQMGKEADHVPPGEMSFAAPARIAKFWTAELARVDLTAKDQYIDFSQAPVGTVLDGYESRGEWVLNRTAETIAKSVAVPCLFRLHGEEEDAENILGEEGMPSPFACVWLSWKLQNDS